MNYQARAFGFSVAIHAFILTCILWAGIIVPKNKVVVLDFSLSQAARPAPAPVRQKVPAPVRQKAAVHERQIATPLEASETAAPVAPIKVAQDMPQPASPAQPADGTHSSPTAAIDDNSTAAEASVEALKAGYISSNLAQIREKILKNFSYPLVARKLRKSGKVMVAFTVCKDGSVEEISVVESSGFSVLDKKAVDTIKKSCPLPTPPVKTSIIMPIVYRLE